MTAKSAVTSRKGAPVKFLMLASAGHVREAYDACVAPGFRHHNPYFAGDAEALAAAMAENAAQNPHKTLDVLRALEDGDLVAVNSRVRLKPEGPVVALVHIFRFVRDHIVELWDIAQPVPTDSPNIYGMF